jgi:hypothetical protein
VQALRPEVDRLRTLTPGDFAAVRRKHEMLGHIRSAHELVAALAAECEVKPDGREGRRIGFGRVQ